MTRGQTSRLKKAFLDHFRRMGNITAACRALGLERRNVYSWQEHDEAFSHAFRQAEIEATETLEAEAFRRGHDGTLKPVFHQGRAVGEVLEYSDTLLIFLLKARAPEKYRETYTPGAAAGPDDVTVGYGDGVQGVAGDGLPA